MVVFVVVACDVEVGVGKTGAGATCCCTLIDDVIAKWVPVARCDNMAVMILILVHCREELRC